MSTEEPSEDGARETPPPAAPPPPPAAPDLSALARPQVLLIILAVGLVLALATVVLSQGGLFGRGGGDAESYAVEPFTPATELITARERVEAYAQPDTGSAVVVMFGEGVTLNVTGRVSRGLNNDWYVISWNDRTAFVRQQDAVAGSGAPPTPEVRERPEEEELEEEKEPEEEEEDPFAEEEQVAVAPSGTLGIGDVNWIREPSARDFARFYPTSALDAGQSGRVVLDCVIAPNGRLDCSVADESPGGRGFGQAALSISRQVRVRSTLPDGSPAAGRHMRLPLSFRAG